jgi:uncharacterized membrane protein
VRGTKYLLAVFVFMIIVLLGSMIVLEQFNSMVYPAHITAFSLNIEEAGWTIEIFGENIWLCPPDHKSLTNMVEQSRQLLKYYVVKIRDKGELFITQINNFIFSDCIQQVVPKSQ